MQPTCSGRYPTIRECTRESFKPLTYLVILGVIGIIGVLYFRVRSAAILWIGRDESVAVRVWVRTHEDGVGALVVFPHLVYVGAVVVDDERDENHE